MDEAIALRRLDEIYSTVSVGESELLYPNLGQEISRIWGVISAERSPMSLALFEVYLRLISFHRSIDFHVPIDFANRTNSPPVATLNQTLGGIPKKLPPGISLVTCSRNRTANLIIALRSWLFHECISEILIVDWSSDNSILDELRDSGICDDRIRVARVMDEPRWVLSYAFNIGFRLASYDSILKVDADVILSSDFFHLNKIEKGSFIAGNWRASDRDQTYVNGFFFLSVELLHHVNGFNEFITTYGWDDDDLYERLTASGYLRFDVASDTVYHLSHSDGDRVGGFSGTDESVRTLWDQISFGTRLLIDTNRILAGLMPPWGQSQVNLPCVAIGCVGNALVLRRNGRPHHEVPEELQSRARDLAVLARLEQLYGHKVSGISIDAIGCMLQRPADEFSMLDVELALINPSAVIHGAGRYLLIEIREKELYFDPAFELALKCVINLAGERQLSPVLLATSDNVSLHCAARGLLPIIRSKNNIGPLIEVKISALRVVDFIPSANLFVLLDRDLIHSMNIGDPVAQIA